MVWIVILIFNSFLFALLNVEEEEIDFLLLTFLLFFYSQILGIFTFLGALRLLSPFNITFSFLLITCLLYCFVKRNKGSLRFTVKSSDKVFSTPFSVIPFFFIMSTCFLNIYHRLLLPPLTTDGLLYHLPFAVEFFKTHNIGFVSLYFTDISMTYYPQGGTMFYLFTLYSGVEYLYKFTQFPFLLMGGTALYLLSKDNGFPNVLSACLFCIFALMKPIIKESFLIYVDLIMASSFLVALYCFSSTKKKYIPLGFLAATLLISTKNFVLIYLLPLIPFFFFKKEGRLSRKLILSSLLFFICIGCFTYIRNMVVSGNPMFPAEISIGGVRIFHGMFSYKKGPFINAINTIVNLWIKPISDVDPVKYLSFILFLSLLLSIPMAFIKDRKIFYILLIIPASIILYLLLIPPVYYQIRHLLPIYSILSLSLIYPFKHLKKYQFIAFIFPGIFLIENLMLLRLIVQCIFLSVILYLLFLFWVKKGKYIQGFIFPSVMLLLLLGWKLILTYDIYPEIRYEPWKIFYGKQGELWEFAQKNSAEPKNIAYVGEFFLYPFYGVNYKNNVFYQSVNSIDTLPIHKYERGATNYTVKEAEKIYRKNFSYELWYAGLKKKKIDWIILRNNISYPEHQWLEENPEIFKKIFSNEYADIYLFENNNSKTDTNSS